MRRRELVNRQMRITVSILCGGVLVCLPLEHQTVNMVDACQANASMSAELTLNLKWREANLQISTHSSQTMTQEVYL